MGEVLAAHLPELAVPGGQHAFRAERSSRREARAEALRRPEDKIECLRLGVGNVPRRTVNRVLSLHPREGTRGFGPQSLSLRRL